MFLKLYRQLFRIKKSSSPLPDTVHNFLLFGKKDQYHPNLLNLLLKKWNQRNPTFILCRTVPICTSWWHY